jgi:7-cyano-7-deazaguanine synthase in queuosine biosynthesis
MRLICAPSSCTSISQLDALVVVLYGQANDSSRGEIGAAIRHVIHQNNLIPSLRAWDILSIALSVISADLAGHRRISPDGWTRQFELYIVVHDPDFWNSQKDLIESQLAFLTTDHWKINFFEGKIDLLAVSQPNYPKENCVALLSGGLDSLIGASDLAAQGNNPYIVSQLVRGDADKQREFSKKIGGGLQHLQLNHNAKIPNTEQPPSQRARSIIFLAYGVLMSTALKSYHDGEVVPLYVNENGFISVNPPLTRARLGSLSTRTTHPTFLTAFQKLLDSAEVNVCIKSPYQFKTKGEMLLSAKDQEFLEHYAHTTTSCGRYKTFGYRHCGRCVPCLVRRAAFYAWDKNDLTEYKYQDLSIDDFDHARFGDVRAVAMAVAEVNSEGIDTWIGASLSSALAQNFELHKEVVVRGLIELKNFLDLSGVQ